MELILEVRELIAAMRLVAELGTKEAWLRATRLALGLLLRITESLDAPPVRDMATFSGEPRSLIQLCDELENQCALAEAPVSHGSGGLLIVLLPIVFKILERLLAR